MKKLIICFSILICFNSELISQPFYLGGSFEAFLAASVKTHSNLENEFMILPTSIYAIGGYSFNNFFIVELKAGPAINYYISTLDYGLTIRSYLLNRWSYLSIGIVNLIHRGSSRITNGTLSKTFNSLLIGIGFDATNIFSFQLDYQKILNTDFQFSLDDDLNKRVFQHYVSNIKLCMILRFDL
ncbi:MAG: hypothetical protein K9J16_13985 [Melioribacteraceae bacterium]|nr:hypothetical protein [Melioribacteraceae bacterium]MCF8356345.1 hypothetical protein [Melioribacteraceae bacterium]MCF8395754.1 hypothetical protein [Melioribacteraceae bacterium]MCF8420556.1 hypothetical protein [Melioribacteraceae bacterium]